MQALSNLLDNALKFSPRGSEIVLRVEPDSSAAGIRFSVEDHGPGLTADAVSHVYDRYWQEEATAHKGAGLGLAIV